MVSVFLKAFGYAVLGAVLGALSNVLIHFDYTTLGILGSVVAGLAALAAEALSKLASKFTQPTA